jgi:hypothetical protein
VDTYLQEKRKAKVVEAVPPGQPPMWLGQPAATWRLTALVKLVELPHGPINTPLRWKSEHTHHTLEIALTKLSFLVQ